MKVLHSALVRSKKVYSGVINQMALEEAAAKKAGISWDVKLFTPDRSETLADSAIFTYPTQSSQLSFKNFILNRLQLRLQYYRWLFQQSKVYDALVVRYMSCDIFLFIFMLACKKPVYLTYHTLELAEMKTLNQKGLYYLAQICRLLNFVASSGYIGVTKEIVESRPFQTLFPRKPVCVYPNGIIANDFRTLQSKRQQELPTIVFVSSYFYPWHGLDLLLDNVKRSNLNFKLHIVGRVDNELIVLANKDKRIIFHGNMDQQKLDKLLEQCEVGIASLALYRKDMNEACSLKVREYLSKGIPVFSGHKDVFPPDSFFYKIGSGQIQDIIDFRNSTIEKNPNEVLNSARSFIDKTELIIKLYNWILSNHSVNAKQQ